MHAVVVRETGWGYNEIIKEILRRLGKPVQKPDGKRDGIAMTTVYLVRHAEAEGNLYRIAQGQDNSNLTDRGWRQVRALERRFADVHIDAVYSSDLYRTCATASAIYKPKGLPLIRERGLREISVGAWDGTAQPKET